jgi:hypothetical protein
MRKRGKKGRIRRPCGGCVACCTAIKVASVGKRAQQDCEFAAADKGCSIYKKRPWECKQWNCYWRVGADGFDAKTHRPDRLGVVVHEGALNDGRGIFFYEVIDGAFSSPDVRTLIRKWNALLPVALIPKNPKRVESGDPLGEVFLPGTLEAPMLNLATVGAF